MSGWAVAISSSSARLLLHFPFTLQVRTRSDGPRAAVSRAQGMQNPITGPKTTIAAAPNTHSKRRRISPAAGASTASGTAQSHRGPNRITVANHQRSPPSRSSSHTASTAATYNHVQTATAVDGQRRLSPPPNHHPTLPHRFWGRTASAKSSRLPAGSRSHAPAQKIGTRHLGEHPRRASRQPRSAEV